VKIVAVLHGVKVERNNLRTIKIREAIWIGHILSKNCLLKHVIEGKVGGRTEVTGRRGRRFKQLLNDLKREQEDTGLKKKHYVQ